MMGRLIMLLLRVVMRMGSEDGIGWGEKLGRQETQVISCGVWGNRKMPRACESQMARDENQCDPAFSGVRCDRDRCTLHLIVSSQGR